MTTLQPDPCFRLDEFARTSLDEHADGWRAGTHWLATNPPMHEVYQVARIHRDLHDGGSTGCDTVYYDATLYGTFLDFLKGGPYEREVLDGVQEMAELNRSQGTAYPAWPRQAFAVSFDEAHLLGFAAAAHTALKAGHR